MSSTEAGRSTAASKIPAGSGKNGRGLCSNRIFCRAGGAHSVPNEPDDGHLSDDEREDEIKKDKKKKKKKKKEVIMLTVTV